MAGIPRKLEAYIHERRDKPHAEQIIYFKQWKSLSVSGYFIYYKLDPFKPRVTKINPHNGVINTVSRDTMNVVASDWAISGGDVVSITKNSFERVFETVLKHVKGLK